MKPAAFLDRDGVLNIDTGYTHKLEDLRFTPTAAEAVRTLNDADYLVVVVTNQSGVARGLYGTADIEAFHAHMQQQLARHGAHIDAFYYCAFHPGGTVPAFSMDHGDRKPSPGMLFRAFRDLPIRRGGSFMIGDKQSDLDAASAAGIPAILVPRDVCDLAASVREILAAQGVAGTC